MHGPYLLRDLLAGFSGGEGEGGRTRLRRSLRAKEINFVRSESPEEERLTYNCCQRVQTRKTKIVNN